MTSDTTPNGEAFASSCNAESQRAFAAFDNNSSTSWHSANGNYRHYVGYHFENPVRVNMVTLAGYYGNRNVVSTYIEASTDGINYNKLTDISVDNVNYNLQTFIFENKNYYSYYRFSGIPLADVADKKYFLTAVSLQFYGRC